MNEPDIDPRRFAAGEIDVDGNELGDYCAWAECGKWFPYLDSIGPYCSRECAFTAERD